MLFRATRCLHLGAFRVARPIPSRAGFISPYSAQPLFFLPPILPLRAFATAEDARGIDGSKDYYRVLGLSASATEAQIKKAFYELAKKYHPDGASSNASNQAKQEAETKFKQINEAYAIIGKKEKRTLYDDIRRATKNTRNSYQADQTWSYTYDAKGNRRTNTYTSHQEDMRGHYSSKSYEDARKEYYKQNHGVNQDGSYRYQGGERYTANWEDWVNDRAQTSYHREQRSKQQGSHRSSGSQFNQNQDPNARGRPSHYDYKLPNGMSYPRAIMILGFVFLIGGQFFIHRDIDLHEGARLPQSAHQPKGGRYQREMFVDPKTGDVRQMPVISETARQQSGGLMKQDPEELRRQKQERQAEAKRIRKERRKLEREFQDQLDDIAGIQTSNKSISSEEYFTSVTDMIQHAQLDTVQSNKSDTAKKRKKDKDGGEKSQIDAGEMNQMDSKSQPLVIIEQTPEGPKKHVFKGDVKMIQGNEEIDVDQQIKREQQELEQFIQYKKEKLKQLQMEKLKNTHQKMQEIDRYAQEDLRSKKQQYEEQFRQQKRESVEVRINPKLIGADINIVQKGPQEFQHMQGGPFAK